MRKTQNKSTGSSKNGKNDILGFPKKNWNFRARNAVPCMNLLYLNFLQMHESYTFCNGKQEPIDCLIFTYAVWDD